MGGKQMETDEIEEILATITDPKSAEEVKEEQQIGAQLFGGLFKALNSLGMSRWLYSMEWEDALVPVRLPKGMSELLKTADGATTELTAFGHCEGCKRKIGCPLLQRNPSEILLTYLMKLAFTEMVVRKGPPK